jgi:hypothetical protein
MTVSAPQRVAHVIFSTSSSMEEATALLPMLAFTFTRKLRPIAIGSLSGGSRSAAGRRGRGPPRRARARGAALAQGDELHLRRDVAAAGVGELGDRPARQRAARLRGAGEDAVEVRVSCALSPLSTGCTGRPS